MDIQISDLLMLLKAIEVAHNKNSFNELEIQAFKPSFDKVHNFLNAYQAQAEAQSQALAQETVANETTTATETTTEESVKIDTVADTTKVGTKAKKSKKA